MIRYRAISLVITLGISLAVGLASSASSAQTMRNDAGEELFTLSNEKNLELSTLIDLIANITGRNFIYDNTIRGSISIVAPEPMTVEQAYAVFEAVLHVRKFAAVKGPGGIYKIVPIRDAKESNLETIMDQRPSRNRDSFVTRLIPLQNIDAQAITNTLKTLISKDASMVAYAPTNTIIITDTEANIQRLLTILEAIDIVTHKEELAVIKIKYADASTLGQQISEIYDSQVTATGSSASRRSSSSRSRSRSSTTSTTAAGNAPRQPVRIITDDRTNSLLILAAREQLTSIRDLIRQLDVPVYGQGRVHVYYLKHSDAEELAQTLNSLLSGQRSSGSAGRSGAGAGQAQALRSAVTELAEGVSLTADPATNSLVIQASKEAYATLLEVIDKLDIPRPQVLVEALIVEVDITDRQALGFSAAVRYVNGDANLFFGTIAQGAEAAAGASVGKQLIGLISKGSLTGPASENQGYSYAAIISAAASNADINILSSPHILTSDNEEAEIRIGNNIPIITSRVSQATGAPIQSTSVNIERMDIGVTLRVTPQISEGNTVRLKIFQSITQIDESVDVGDVNQVGVALLNREVENTVVVASGETVVIGGLISELYSDSISKVPWLGDIPWIGWAFKSTTKTLRKINLLIFLTPYIIRSPADLEYETIRRREQLELASGETIDAIDVARYVEDAGSNPVRRRLIEHSRRYPATRMAEIQQENASRRAALDAAKRDPEENYQIRAGIYSDVESATRTLTTLLDAGFEGSLLSTESGGVIFYEIQIGPFSDKLGAVHASQVLREAHRLTPSITLIEDAAQ